MFGLPVTTTVAPASRPAGSVIVMAVPTSPDTIVTSSAATVSETSVPIRGAGRRRSVARRNLIAGPGPAPGAPW